jgi:hypothetical protein
MAWDWVSPTATAAVGIAAVGFASRTSFKSEMARAHESAALRKHERDLVVRRERLEMFAAFLEAVDGYAASLVEANHAMGRWRKEGHSRNDPLPDAITVLLDRLHDIDSRYQAARLVGSAAVGDAGEAVRTDANRALAVVTKSDDEWSGMSRSPHDDLVAAMREDLGNVD